jgi:hypothetical protein
MACKLQATWFQKTIAWSFRTNKSIGASAKIGVLFYQTDGRTYKLKEDKNIENIVMIGSEIAILTVSSPEHWREVACSTNPNECCSNWHYFFSVHHKEEMK